MIDETTPLLLAASDLAGLVTAEDAILAVEKAHMGWSELPAHGALCRRTRTAEDTRVCVHQGTAPDLSATGLFVHAEAITSAADREVLRGRGSPVTVVYRTEDAALAGILLGEPTFAELPDSSAIAGVRTAATTIAGTRALSRPDSEVLGLIGTGKQAMAHLAAARAGMPPRSVVVFSRDQSRAAAFATEASQMFGLETTALESAREVIESSDIVITTTNSRHPVFDGAWLSPGQHVTSIVGGVARTGTSEKPGRRELDDETDRRAAVIAYTSLEQARIGFDDVTWDTLPELSADGDPARPFGVRAIDLGDLLNGRVDGRRSATDLTVFKNNAGQGVADLAIAALALTRARETGRGIPLNP